MSCVAARPALALFSTRDLWWEQEGGPAGIHLPIDHKTHTLSLYLNSPEELVVDEDPAVSRRWVWQNNKWELIPSTTWNYQHEVRSRHLWK